MVTGTTHATSASVPPCSLKGVLWRPLGRFNAVIWVHVIRLDDGVPLAQGIAGRAVQIAHLVHARFRIQPVGQCLTAGTHNCLGDIRVHCGLIATADLFVATATGLRAHQVTRGGADDELDHVGSLEVCVGCVS